MIWMNI